MSFWQNTQTAAGMAGVLHWVAIGFALSAFLLFLFVPPERKRIRTSTFLYALSFAGLLAAGALLSSGVSPESLVYRCLRWLSLFVESAAIINLASVFVFDVALNTMHLNPTRILRDLLLGVGYVVVAVTLLSRSGFDLAGIVATSAVITAVIGFSLADTLGNIMGGMALQMEHTIKVGDWISVDQIEGRVKEIRWRQTSIETRYWDTVVIPNSTLMKGKVILLGQRLGAPCQRCQQVHFNVDFRFPPTDVISAVEKALRAKTLPKIAAEPAPQCLITDFKDSYATYAARYWLTDLASSLSTDSMVRSRIYFALRRADIPLSIPAQSVFLTEDTESRRERKHSEEIERRVKALQQVELFHMLTDDERHELAGRLRSAPFVRGEALTKQGAEAHWLYMIIEGEAEVQVAVDQKSEKVAALCRGDIFGEMGLMTGESRTATVIALTDVLCYRLDKNNFQDILQHRPEIAKDISGILAHRRVELETVREELDEETIRERMHHAQKDLLHRISEFFRLGASQP